MRGACAGPLQSVLRMLATMTTSGCFIRNPTKEIETPDSMEYRFFPTSTLAIKFSVRAAHDAHIAITPGPVEANPMYEIFIGGWENSKIAIRRNREKPEVVEHPFPNTLSASESRSFWVTFYDKVIALGLNEENTPILVWQDPNMFEVTHFGIRTSWGASGSWRIEDNWSGWRAPSAPQQAAEIGWNVAGMTGEGTWIPASGGTVPPNAVPGGFDSEQLYIGRAAHAGAIIPGKVHPSHGVCYIPWGGSEHAIPEYEVLCDCRGTWLVTAGDNIPPTAVQGGSAENGEPLYIGRASHNDTITVGKIQKSHGVCYIPYGGQEIGKAEYEVLVLQ